MSDRPEHSDALWDRWEEVDRLFDEALDLAPGEREAFLSAGRHDREVVEAVRALLGRVETAGLDPAGASPLRSARPELGEAWKGERLGRYELGEVLGRGGMATVYAAQRVDGAFERRVAVKILRPGLDTHGIVDRFLRERQILSDLEHPHIARLLDGGTAPDGRPFLVMEYVDGAPITEWADARRLDVPARLRLFRQVLSAVGEAHRRLVVHRDLKPSNIFVDVEGRVRLLDFGIAKLLEGGSGDGQTEWDWTPLTRRFASPEQVHGGPITLSTDIYQLGLVLHLLLSGVHPHAAGAPTKDGPSLPAMSRALSGLSPGEGEARARLRGSTPDALVGRLRGDLDTIVAKCLAWAPGDRFGSIEALDADLRRHMDQRPILARPAPWTLRTRKWVARNRWAPPTAAVFTLGIAAWIGTLLVSQQRIVDERNVARAEAARADQVQSLLIDVLRSSDPFGDEGGAAHTEPTVTQALIPAAERARARLAGHPDAQADVLSAVADVLQSWERREVATEMVDSAIAVRELHGLDESPAFARDLEILAALIRVEQPDSAAALLGRAIGLLRSILAPNDPRLAHALAERQWLEINHTGVETAEAGEEALRIYTAAGVAYERERAGVLGHLSYVYGRLNRPDDARMAAERSYELVERSYGAAHSRTALAATRLGQLHFDQQRPEAAVPLLQGAAEIMALRPGPTHGQTLTVRNNLALALAAAGRLDEAIAIDRDVIRMREQAQGGRPTRELANAHQNLATHLKDAGRWDEAVRSAERARSVYREVTPEGHYLRAFPLLTTTEVHLLAGRPLEAVAVARDALAILEEALPTHYATHVARCRLGLALFRSDDRQRGEVAVRAASDALDGTSSTPPSYLEECRAARSEVEAGAAP